MTCPTPGKIPYRSRAEARAAAKGRQMSGNQRPYACGDHWHLTHMGRKAKKRRQHDPSPYHGGRGVR